MARVKDDKGSVMGSKPPKDRTHTKKSIGHDTAEPRPKNFLTMVPKRNTSWRRVDPETLKVLAKREDRGVVREGMAISYDWIKNAKVVIYGKKEMLQWQLKVVRFFGVDDSARVWLDDFGASVWLLMDGHRNIEQIGLGLREAYGDRAEPLYPRLNKFLNILDARKLIILDIHDPEMAKRAKKRPERSKNKSK